MDNLPIRIAVAGFPSLQYCLAATQSIGDDLFSNRKSPDFANIQNINGGELMVNKDRTQFLIECKNGEAANILYGLLHDKTLFLPELSLVNAHPKMFDSDFPLDFPHNMDIDSRYILNLD